MGALPIPAAGPPLPKVRLAPPRSVFLPSTWRPAALGLSSVRVEGILIVELERRILPRLVEEAVADDERLDLGTHEAAERVLGRADDRLAAHVEAGVDEHRAAGRRLERLEQAVETGVGLLVHRLDARRVVDVRDRRD